VYTVPRAPAVMRVIRYAAPPPTTHHPPSPKHPPSSLGTHTRTHSPSHADCAPHSFPPHTALLYFTSALSYTKARRNYKVAFPYAFIFFAYIHVCIWVCTLKLIPSSDEFFLLTFVLTNLVKVILLEACNIADGLLN
jgi:hypothetical protein